jgi:hypothetical protein
MGKITSVAFQSPLTTIIKGMVGLASVAFQSLLTSIIKGMLGLASVAFQSLLAIITGARVKLATELFQPPLTANFSQRYVISCPGLCIGGMNVYPGHISGLLWYTWAELKQG